MSYTAKVLRAMIASPSDVPQERQIVRDVIGEWTAIHSADREAVLLPVSWESHSAPEMGDRPQGIINKRLLHDCDLLIAVFWTRVGTPTGAAVSGTVEEIEEHIAAGKPAMIYFSQAPVRPDSVESEQYEQLKAFKLSCQQRGLYENYESLSEFRTKLGRQLAQTMIRLTEQEEPAVVLNASTRTLPVPFPLPIGAGEQGNSRKASKRIDLPKAAATMLKKMSVDGGGDLLRLNVLGGVIFQVGKEELNVQGDARDTAKWESALETLERARLIRATGSKREIFNLTNDGYEAADDISADDV